MSTLPTNGPTVFHRGRLAAGEFLIQTCEACHSAIYYPRIACPYCAETNLAWFRPSGRGTIYARSIVNRPDRIGGPYNVVLVDLEERVRLMSTVVDASPEDIVVGAPVVLAIEELEGEPAPVFRLAEEGARQ